MAKNNIVLKKDVILFLQDQKDSSADLIIADPPYNICIDK
jgi:DNA modification methylase